MKKNLPILIALLSANVAVANDALDKFLEDTTVDVKARSIVVQMNPNDVDFSDNAYDSLTAAGFLLANDPATAAGLVATFDGLGGYGPSTPDASSALDVQTAIDGLGQLAAVTEGINSALKEGVERQGTLDQAGSAVWVQLESGYLYDIVGFDLGFQGAIKHFKDDESEKLIISSQSDESYSRISTARVKLRYGSEDVYAKAHYGYYSDADETDYLMDTSDLKYGASAHYNDFSLSYSATLASSGNTESDYTDKDPISQSVELKYASEFGEASAKREFTTNVETTDTFKAQSGVPFAFMGLPIPEDKALDYLLVGQVAYGMKTIEASDVESNQYEVVLAAKLDGVTLAASYNKASDEGGAGIAELTDNALINDYDMFGQSTITYVAKLDGTMFGLSGLSVSAVHLTSEVDKDLQLAKGDSSYFFTGDSEFTETLVDASYRFQNGLLEGLQLRTVFGSETNQANVSGYGVFVDYDFSF